MSELAIDASMSTPHISAIMYFKDGQQCYGAGKRTATVKLTCADSNEILSVEEPNKCEYDITMRTPAACIGPIDATQEVLRQAVFNAPNTIVGQVKQSVAGAVKWVKSMFS
jgi:hypothetical protein